MNSKFAFRLVSFILIIIICLSVCAVAPFSALSSNNSVVTTDAVRLRSTPKINDNNYIATLGVSEVLTLLSDSSNGWANVKRENGDKGYCSVDYLNVPSRSAVKFTGVTTDEVNFRKGPSTDYASLGILSAGQSFSVIDNSNEYWVKASVEGEEGYIYRSYCVLGLALGSVSEETEPTTKPSIPTEPTVPEATTTVATEPSEVPVLPDAPNVDPVTTPNWYASSLLESDISSKFTLKADFTLTDSSVSVKAGESYNLSTLIIGDNLDSLVTFKSSDNSVAKVSDGGIIFGVNEGSCIIEASFMGKTATCSVSVSGKNQKPTEPSTTVPESTSPTEEVTTTTPSVTEPNTFELSDSSATIEKGNLFMLTSGFENTTWSSSNENVAFVEGGLVEALSEGKAIITASAQGKTGTCEITVIKASIGLTIEYDEVEVTKGKTFFNSADSSTSIIWTSSDDAVATVSNGFITGISEGKAVITASSSKGTKTCLVNVKAAEPIRFTYAYPNTAQKDEEISLVAITDKTRTSVQFKVDVNGSVKTVNATSKKVDGNTIIWTGIVKLTEAGTFNVTAYSKISDMYTTCRDGKTSVFVRETKDLLKETKENRRASDELISLLSAFEGYVGNVYFDNLAGGIPTLGYGKVVYVGDTFYNDMTKTEAYAQLYDTVNNGGYSSNVNSYLQSLEANYNQQQFDALVTFAYNIGYYGLRSDTEIRALILEAKEKKTDTSTDKKAAYVNGTQVNLRKGAGTEFESLGWLSYPDTLTLVEEKPVNEFWYHIKTADGREGYIYKDYVTLGVPTTEGEIYLSLIDKAEFTRVLLEYHHASSNCIYGLLYRRVDELDLFYYGDYTRDGDENRFGYSFVCVKDENFKL